MFRYILPYDVFERHKKVGSYIKDDQTVVDIGGELNHLSLFCNPQKITVANLTAGDIIITKDKLPFRKNSFDIVTSIDVLEHVPKTRRQQFMEKLYNIASQKVIISFPLGTRRHIQYEKETYKQLAKKGINVPYLREHVKYGLPTESDIKEITNNFKTEVFYSGDININKILFRIFIFDPKIKFLRKLIYFFKIFFNILANEILYLILSDKNYSDSVNRAYIIINKSR